MTEVDTVSDTVTETKTNNNTVLYKVWRRGRFCTISQWKDKVVIDIGAFDEKTNKLTSNTACFLDLHEFLAYLFAEVHGLLPTAFPSFEAEGYLSFGGKETLSRVFKSHFWGDKDNYDRFSRVFKCGHFEGKVSSSGAIQPIYNKSISQSMIKITFEDLIMMYLAVNKAHAGLPNE